MAQQRNYVSVLILNNLGKIFFGYFDLSDFLGIKSGIRHLSLELQKLEPSPAAIQVIIRQKKNQKALPIA